MQNLGQAAAPKEGMGPPRKMLKFTHKMVAIFSIKNKNLGNI